MYIPINQNPMDIKKVLELNPLVLAFVGDSVQQLMVRVDLCSNSTAKAGELHKIATSRVKATNQALLMDKLLPILTSEEMDIYKRTRNTKMNTIAKHASISEYKKASGFEAVIGYLYLLGQNERLEYLMSILEDTKED